MDIASLLSIIGGIAMVIFGVLSSNSFDITAMQMYIDPASIVKSRLVDQSVVRLGVSSLQMESTDSSQFHSRSRIKHMIRHRPSGQLLTCQMSEEKKVCLHLKKLQTELKTNS